MNTLDLLLLAVIVCLPLIVGYGRRLDHWRMTKVWLWLLLPVAGWFISLAISISTKPSDEND